MPRTKFIAGNWKMFTTAQTGRELAAAVVKACAGWAGVRVAVCPPFPYLQVVGEVLRGSPVALGAQNVYPADEGAFTGEVSPIMLKDVGCRYVVVGHSERRHVLGETDSFPWAGGIIRFYTADGKVRFEVNVKAADKAKLKISSKLLKLARIFDKQG